MFQNDIFLINNFNDVLKFCEKLDNAKWTTRVFLIQRIYSDIIDPYYLFLTFQD